jgi:hypothetical protein
MNLGLPAYAWEDCICVDGPLKGHIDKMACLAPRWPCDTKLFPGDNICYTYRIKIINNNSYEKDSHGRYNLYYEEHPYVS